MKKIYNLFYVSLFILFAFTIQVYANNDFNLVSAKQTKKEIKQKSNKKNQVKGKNKVVTTESGLKYEDIKVGTGASPKVGDMVSVHYVGTFEDGSKFDSSRDRGTPFRFRLGMRQVIPGWDEGVATMKIGGQRRLIVPGKLAYGPNGIQDRRTGRYIIPPNATLIFDVELLGINE